ncbi:LexA family transcriptional regulator [Alistipes finegoldii]|jgi:phage repressor protein C with HTH and peptisase S24 domain|uniref:LexA family transcriptional regulator n=1 Tax=Alistipes finegoldii TaxID=214856 RepID=UPI00242DDA74|nr:LexA family transcriptional regulator [Alistipes finegoldii]
MTGNQLKEEIRKIGITQEEAAIRLKITRRTLQNWFALPELDANISQNVKNILGIEVGINALQTAYGDIKMIPLLPLAAQGGSLNEFIVSVKADDCEKIVSPIKGVDFAMTVSGDSMEPEYPSGAKILLKKINEKAFIEWGRVYVLDTCNGSVIKKIMPGPTAEVVTCISINQHYPPFEVAFGDMYGMYRVLMLMSEK